MPALADLLATFEELLKIADRREAELLEELSGLRGVAVMLDAIVKAPGLTEQDVLRLVRAESARRQDKKEEVEEVTLDPHPH
jgi:hypothetical protein